MGCTRLVVLVTLLALAVGAAGAAGLQAAPVKVLLGAGTRSVLLTLRNAGAERMVVQAALLRGERPQGEERYSPSDDLSFNPSLFALDPGRSQVVRIGLRQGSAPAAERSYRIVFEEVDAGDTPSQGLRRTPRLGIPVVVQPDAAPEAALRAAVEFGQR